MAIRIRKVDGHMVALCAAKTKKQKGDIYLNDNLHQVLGEKFYADYVKMGFIKKEKPPQKRALTVDEIISKYPMSIRILLVQLVAQIERLQKNQPQVTKEWIEEKAKRLASMITDYMPYGQKSGEPFELKELQDFIRSLIKEIRGVEVMKK